MEWRHRIVLNGLRIQKKIKNKVNKALVGPMGMLMTSITINFRTSKQNYKNNHIPYIYSLKYYTISNYYQIMHLCCGPQYLFHSSETL